MGKGGRRGCLGRVGRRWSLGRRMRELLTGRGNRVGEVVTGFAVEGEWGGNVGDVGKVGGAVLGGTGALVAAPAIAAAVVATIAGVWSSVLAGVAATTVGLGFAPVLFVPGTLRGKLCLWHTLHFVVIHPHTLVTLDAVGVVATVDPVPAVLDKPVVGCSWVAVGRWVGVVMVHPQRLSKICSRGYESFGRVWCWLCSRMRGRLGTHKRGSWGSSHNRGMWGRAHDRGSRGGN